MMPKWQPGQSGNPGGRPRAIVEIRDLAREHTDSAIAVLVEIMNDRKTPPASRISAATHLLDRAYGRPPQEQHLVVDDDEFLDDRVAEALAEIEAMAELDRATKHREACGALGNQDDGGSAANLISSVGIAPHRRKSR